jgi:hypothetical protein
MVRNRSVPPRPVRTIANNNCRNLVRSSFWPIDKPKDGGAVPVKPATSAVQAMYVRLKANRDHKEKKREAIEAAKRASAAANRNNSGSSKVPTNGTTPHS